MAHPHLKASLTMIVAMAAFVCNDTFVKLTGGRLPVGEIVAIRGALATVIIAAVCWRQGHLPKLALIATGKVTARALLDLAGTLCFVTALMHMPIANLTAMLQVVPLTVTALGALILGERVGWRRMAAIAVGFLGVALIVKPTPSDITPWEILGLGCVLAVSVRDLVTRRIGVHIPSLVIALANAGFVTVGGLVLGLTQEFVPLSALEMGLLIAASVFLAIGYMFMVTTLRLADLSATAPARYTIVLFSILSGMAVFHEFPDAWAVFGIALIVGSGFYAVRREAHLRRNARTLPQSAAQPS